MRPMAPAVEAQIPRQLRARIAQARQRLKAFDYMVRNSKGFDERVQCKGCAQPIAGLVVAEQPLEVVRRDGKVLVREQLVWARFPAYAEVEFEFEGGGFHATPLCKGCAARLDAEMAGDCYAADVDDLARDAGAGGVDWSRWDRRVTRWKRVI